jgi:hypothetical protein
VLTYSSKVNYERNPRLGTCAGWSIESETPVGSFVINYLEFVSRKPIYLVVFESNEVAQCATEDEAKQAAQKHFNELIENCKYLTT